MPGEVEPKETQPQSSFTTMFKGFALDTKSRRLTLDVYQDESSQIKLAAGQFGPGPGVGITTDTKGHDWSLRFTVGLSARVNSKGPEAPKLESSPYVGLEFSC